MAYLPYGCNIFEAPFEPSTLLHRMHVSLVIKVEFSFKLSPFFFVDFKTGIALASRTGFSGPWSLPRQASTDVDPKTFKFDSKGFTAFVDVHSFDPQEISVKTIDHVIIVECRHDSKDDGHGLVERHFVRKFNLPNDYDMSTVKSTLSKDGILQLEAPKPTLQGVERHIEVNETEKPSLIYSLLSNRANSLLRRSHSIPSDAEED